MKTEMYRCTGENGSNLYVVLRIQSLINSQRGRRFHSTAVDVGIKLVKLAEFVHPDVLRQRDSERPSQFVDRRPKLAAGTILARRRQSPAAVGTSLKGQFSPGPPKVRRMLPTLESKAFE
jgi:hypothetical protein